jgi:DNA-binding NarL/FixJ family response regulator
MPDRARRRIQAAQLLRASHPATGVVVLSQHADPSYAIELFEKGSAGRAYLLKERVDDIELLVGAIRTVAAGGSVVDPAIVDALVSARSRSDASPLAGLTARERDVLREIAEGKNNAAAAAALFITERSVEKLIHSIFLKLGLSWEENVHRRVKAVAVSLRPVGRRPQTSLRLSGPKPPCGWSATAPHERAAGGRSSSA